MNRITGFTIAALSLSGAFLQGCSSADNAPAKPDTSFTYPETPKVEQQDAYHGANVSDPYRWLEAMNSDAVKAWVGKQNALARPFLESLPTRVQYKERITTLWDYEKYRVPFFKGGKFFYSHNNGLQNQYVLFVASSPDGEPQVLIDPNTFSEDGTVSMAEYEISPRANKVAYMTSDGGSDWKTIRVRDINTFEESEETLAGVKFTNISWLPDESGFYYSRYPKNAAGEWDDKQSVSIYFHKLGSEQNEDRQVFAFANEPKWAPYPVVIGDGSTMLIIVNEGFDSNAVYTYDLTAPDSTPKPVFDKWDGLYDFIDMHGSELLFLTNHDAPSSKVIAYDLHGGTVRDVIPATDATLDDAALLDGKLVAQYIRNVKSEVAVYDLQGNKLHDIAMPGIGSVEGFYDDKSSQKTYYKLTSYTNPGAIYEHDLSAAESQLYKAISVPADLDKFELRQVFYTSKDGTQVPMFIVHQRGLELDGSHKTLLYGYGGFNVSLMPRYSATRMAWVEQGNVLAIANLRGGGEYGQAWHKAGTRLQKQNVFDDFIAAGEYLIDNGYTTSSRLAIQGGSNGGLLVGAAITQRPDLFGAALPAVGVLDMLRYHTPNANARAWSTDYGLSENADEFDALYAYSPVHNTVAGECYPATLITTGDHDDRVVPWHSYKFAAVLQRDQGCSNPVLLRVETRAGHGAGTPTWMRIESYADQWAFLEAALQ
ncbi:prolyl oligopeptidase family serine peptidase [Alteromonas sp. ASW11-19]|uniref:prolyl oligopeptidase n=1 Tax=Alteromonas salexigens TaxID=2982530 RepID=A0ABT2VL27_9ALTE|nr:prolyl oligopeptidase family serine peptidase [Alteromonas salexigens]MCU7554011.1 prolyl oligopeptidase family serine peptidase [Alteromonas salexigens]